MRPSYKGQHQRKNPSWKPRLPNEKRVPNTLVHTIFINPKKAPWCFPCGDSHWEHACPSNSYGDGSNEISDYMNFLDTLDPIYTISSEEYFNVT
jgi:hypothetical protein